MEVFKKKKKKKKKKNIIFIYLDDEKGGLLGVDLAKVGLGATGPHLADHEKELVLQR
jgi:hypothetical protein